MTLQEAILQYLPLAVDHPSGGRRAAAAVFLCSPGIVFAEVGWPEVGGHPLHVCAGKVSGGGPWRVGQCTVSVIDHGDELVPAWNRWNDWCDWQVADDKPDWRDRDRIREAINASGLLDGEKL